MKSSAEHFIKEMGSKIRTEKNEERGFSGGNRKDYAPELVAPRGIIGAEKAGPTGASGAQKQTPRATGGQYCAQNTGTL
jgi:hypothetical protein